MRSTSTIVELSLLALWLGAALLFSAAVGPPLFAALPMRTLAGAVVGRILPVIFLSGMAVGIAVVSYAGQMVFGLNADRQSAPDVAVLAEGIQQSYEELRDYRRRARRKASLSAR